MVVFGFIVLTYFHEPSMDISIGTMQWSSTRMGCVVSEGNSTTVRGTAVRGAAVRGTCVSWHHGAQLKHPRWNPSNVAALCYRGFSAAFLNLAPIFAENINFCSLFWQWKMGLSFTIRGVLNEDMAMVNGSQSCLHWK